MAIKLNVGLSKKIGLPDFGSLGASCHVEFEIDGGTLQGDLDGFHQRVRQAYAACAQAVNDELARRQPDEAPTAASDCPERPGPNGQASHRASAKQIEYARQLAGQIAGLGTRRLEPLAQTMFSKPLAGLSSLEASGLIDVLKDIKAGKIAVETALSGAAA